MFFICLFVYLLTGLLVLLCKVSHYRGSGSQPLHNFTFSHSFIFLLVCLFKFLTVYGFQCHCVAMFFLFMVNMISDLVCHAYPSELPGVGLP